MRVMARPGERVTSMMPCRPTRLCSAACRLLPSSTLISAHHSDMREATWYIDCCIFCHRSVEHAGRGATFAHQCMTIGMLYCALTCALKGAGI